MPRTFNFGQRPLESVGPTIATLAHCVTGRHLRTRAKHFAGWEWLIPIIKDCNSSIFEHLKDAVLVVDEPGGIESYLSDDYEELSRRYNEIDQADDIALPPEELYLSVEELRTLDRSAATS
jgi:hypothetical protein